jgi:hypothetical protein
MVNGKAKGSSFERDICKRLSLWLTDGKNEDVFWRSSMSGGRATVAKGKVRQAGDITAVSPEGHILTDRLYLECKHLKDISLDCLIKGKGNLITIWHKTIEEAAKYNKIPCLIFRQNHYPIVFCSTCSGIAFLQVEKLVCVSAGSMNLLRFDELMDSKCNIVDRP